LRSQAGLTQAQLADRVEVSDEFMSRLERGLKSPSLDTAGRIADALGVTLAVLFDFDAPTPDGEKEGLLEGLRALLATEEVEKIRLVVEVGRTILRKP
jgi:transcriptional regulator with XRE-family HTH domain